MANENPDTSGLKPGENVKHGFYVDGLLPCANCPVKDGCNSKDKFKDHRGKARCLEEKEFFDGTIKSIKDSFQLDSKDDFQLPQMVMTMIKLKRMNRYIAEQGPTGSTLLFNPKTGAEHISDTPNVLNRDMYYAQKALQAWLDSLKLSRNARDAKEGIDIFMKLALGSRKEPSR